MRLLPAVFLLASLLTFFHAAPAAARELRRQMPFLRAQLMGDAYVAVGDEPSVLLYNPAGLARLKEGAVEISFFHFSADRELTRLLLEPDAVKAEYSGLSSAELTARIGTALFYDLSLRLPFVYAPRQGYAYGVGLETLGAVQVVQDAAGFPDLKLEAFVDQTALWSTFGRFGGLSLGATAKLIRRAGVDKTIDFATLYATGSLDLDSDPDFRALSRGETRQRAGLDLGLLFEFPGAEDWQPRIGLSVLNLGGRDSQQGYHGIQFSTPPDENTRPVFGELPLNVALGFAVSPTFAGVRYTLALDLVDLTKTALEGDSLNNRTRVGCEVGVGPHEDGTALFSLLFGWNATHFSLGVLSRVTFFEIGFGRYRVEKGAHPGADPEDRRVLLLALRF